MHQAHTIPWNTLASHLTFVRDNPHRTPRTTGIFPSRLVGPTRADDLNHFVRVLADTIRSFAHTERAKHPPGDVLASWLSSPPSSASTPVKLFDDTLLDRYPEYLNVSMQSPDYWVRRATCVTSPGGNDVRYMYTTRHGDLADAVKVLMYATDLRAVLCLAHLVFPASDQVPGNVADPHPKYRSESGVRENVDVDNATNVDASAAPVQCRSGDTHHVPDGQVQAPLRPSRLPSHPRPRPAPLASLARLSWGHYFGVQRLASSALCAYIYINLASALGILADGRWMETSYLESLVRETTSRMDFDAQQIPHRAFWAGMGVRIEATRSWETRSQLPGFDKTCNERIVTGTWTHEVGERTKDYVKELFRLMFAYEMVMCECGAGGGMRWEREIILTLRMMTKLKVKLTNTECVFV